MRVVVFGGSFDPPHVGHVLALTYALLTHDLDEALVVPVHSHPFEKDLAPFDDRVAMARLAFASIAKVTVSTVEATLAAPSLTVRTLEHLSREHPDWTLHLLVGSDALSDSSKWAGWHEIERQARLIVLGRVHAEHPDAPPALIPDVSSTKIRSLLRSRPKDGEPMAELARLVPHSVLDYVRAHGLYE